MEMLDHIVNRTGDSQEGAEALDATRQAIARHADRPGPLLPILHDIAHAVGWIPAPVVPVIAEALNLSRAEVHGVITFYPHFRTRAPGRMRVEVCRAESCQAMGGEAIADHARQRLGCDFSEVNADGSYSLDSVYCLGLCAQSPSIMINGRPYARITPEKFDRLIAPTVATAEINT
jgi:formate dehydrogenase subunit gamma